MTAGERTLSVREVVAVLHAQYGALPWRSHGDGLSELVLTILSQHTNDRLSGQAFQALLQRFPGWQAVADAPVAAIEDAIRVGGLAAQKAPRIAAVLRQVMERSGSFDLAFLGALPVDEARQWLMSLPGVGPKTAACVLMFALGVPAIPVDTHVHRVGLRLGILPDKMSADRAHTYLDSVVPAADAYTFHAGLIRHGRHVCLARRPACETCAFQHACPSAVGQKG